MSERFAELTAFADEVLAPGFGPITLDAKQAEDLMEMLWAAAAALERQGEDAESEIVTKLANYQAVIDNNGERHDIAVLMDALLGTSPEGER